MNTHAKNNAVRDEISPNDVENTVSGFSSSLLAKRKKVVSIPNVSITRKKAA